MKSVQLFGPKDLRLVDIPKPRVSDTDVLIKVKAVGICGTDLHLYTGDLTPPPPFTPGHEFVGEVAAVGSKVTRFHVGQKVVAEHVIGCGTCIYCKDHKPNVCVSPIIIGVTIPGALAEYVAIPQELVYALPENMSLDEGVLVEPLSIAVYSLKQAAISRGQIVAVIGQGPIGLLLDIVAKSAGAKVYGFDILQNRLDYAKKHNLVTDVIDSSDIKAVEQFISESGAGGAHIAFEAVGMEPTMALAIKTTRSTGTIVVLGVFGKPVMLDMMQAVKRELTIKGSWTSINSFQDTIDLVASGKIPTSTFITHRYPFDQAKKAFEDSLNDRQDRIKTIIEF